VETTVPVPLFILIFGVAIVIGRNRPILLTAGIFLLIGGLAITGVFGPAVVEGLEYLLQPIT
jgi:hypothetical protein